MGGIRLQRAHDPPGRGEGYRVPVDRIWPRERSKAELALDAWRQDLAPGTPLRRRLGHDPARWAESERRHLGELATAAPGDLPDRCRAGAVTRVCAARDERHNHGVVLGERLRRQAGGRG